VTTGFISNNGTVFVVLDSQKITHALPVNKFTYEIVHFWVQWRRYCSLVRSSHWQFYCVFAPGLTSTKVAYFQWQLQSATLTTHETDGATVIPTSNLTGSFHPFIGHKSPLNSALEGGEGSASRPGRTLPPGKTRYPLYRRLGGSQGRSGQVRKISPPPEFDPRTVQPVGSRYTDYATWPTSNPTTSTKSLLIGWPSIIPIAALFWKVRTGTPAHRHVERIHRQTA
jgi:hypothetical protein